ncbi:dihydropteroate synthase [Enterococcus sp. LJL90]
MFDFTKKQQIMGILNVTPDSFSDGGHYTDIEAAVEQAEALALAGADVIDIGGQSTRPGYQEITPAEELARILPVVEAVKQRISVPLSVDTYFPEVAQAVISAGVEIINDIKGLDQPGMAELLAANPEVAMVIMHSRKRREVSLITDLQEFYQEKVAQCQQHGISLERIAFDPGVGFHKSVAENLAIMAQPQNFRFEKLPLLYGVSRKRTIGTVTGETNPLERDYASVTASLFALEQGVEMVRVHNVAGMRQALIMWDALKNLN